MMKRSIKTTGLALVFLATALAGITPALAQMGQGQMGRGGVGGCGALSWTEDDPVPTFANGRIAFLKAELAITDAQEKVWDAYAEAVKNNFVNMYGLRQAMAATFGASTPTERLEARIAVMEGRAATLQDMTGPLADLYGALSAEQKQKANELLTTMGCMM